MSNNQPDVSPIYTNVLAKIEEYGYTTMGIFPAEGDNSPSFSYTVGCAIHGGYEYCIAGLNPTKASSILHSVYEQLLTGWRPVDKEKYYDFANMPIKFQLMFGNHQANMSRWYWKNAETSFSVMQLIWPDTNGVFPGEELFETRFLASQIIEGSPLSFNWN